MASLSLSELKPQQHPLMAALQNALAIHEGLIKQAYAQPNAQQALQKAILENQYNPQIWKSEIGLRGAQADHTGAEANKTNFLTNNPEYISAEGALMQQQMQNQGRQQGKMPQHRQPQGQDAQINYRPERASQGDEGLVNYSNPQIQQFSNEVPANQQFSPQRYNPNALAYNPPSMPSPTGNQNLDPLYYKKFGMSPVQQAQLDLAQSKAQKYNEENVARNKEFNNQAIVANESSLNAHKFIEAEDHLDKMETGPWGGKIPAFSDEAQNADVAANNMAGTAAQLFQNGHAVHATDIELAQMSKTNRKLNRDVAIDLAQGLVAKNDRMKERQQAYAFGAQLGLKPEIMDQAFNKYETERPYINTATKMPNDAYKGTWKDYFSPEAVNAFIDGKDYTPPNQKTLQGMNWTKTDLDGLEKWAKARGQKKEDASKRNLYRIARNEGLTLSQLKSELMKYGELANES